MLFARCTSDLSHEPSWPHGWGEPSEPDLKLIIGSEFLLLENVWILLYVSWSIHSISSLHWFLGVFLCIRDIIVQRRALVILPLCTEELLLLWLLLLSCVGIEELLLLWLLLLSCVGIEDSLLSCVKIRRLIIIVIVIVILCRHSRNVRWNGSDYLFQSFRSKYSWMYFEEINNNRRPMNTRRLDAQPFAKTKTKAANKQKTTEQEIKQINKQTNKQKNKTRKTSQNRHHWTPPEWFDR